MPQLPRRPLVGLAASAALVLSGLAVASTTPASAAAPGWKPRPAEYPGTVTTTDLKIPMDDGKVLRGDLTLPADGSGTAVPGRFPVVVTITAYNKSSSSAGGLAGPSANYLVQRGYAQLTVDARGTGSSEGVWRAFSRREGKDAGEVVEWAHSQKRPWSDGKVAMTGPSYMGISQLFAAARQPAGLKAIFPQVPAGDVYRDVVASGGQIDIGFIPLWLGLVTATGLVPPAYGAQEPEAGFHTITDRFTTATTFTAPLLAQAALGQDPAYDGKFYRDRSPLRVIDRVQVPTFLIGGEYDLFQRGTPMDFDALQRNGVPTKLIIGPWDHLEGSSGSGVGEAGYGSLSELQLRWFDHYVQGRPDPTLDSDISDLTYYEQGTGRWVQKGRYLAGDLQAKNFYLGGSAAPGLAPGTLTTRPGTTGDSTVPPVPVAGLCTRSANQWTAGIANAIWPDNPCLKDNQVNDDLGVVFQTEPLTDTLRFQGPINARLYASTPAGDGMLSVAVEDVAPDGSVHRITGGWQVLSQRALDRSRTRYLDGEIIQPFHPFTAESKKPLDGTKPIDVEIFPTGAAIQPGHRLRISVQAFDVPHLAPSAPDLPGTLVPITLHVSQEYPSRVTLPVR